MRPPLDEQYLRWLYSQVSRVTAKNPQKTYWTFLRKLKGIEFVWFVPNDDNRIVDGKHLRFEFLEELKLKADDVWLDAGCSMLEMLIGLSRRLAFETEDEPRDWFWRLIDNLDLSDLNDKDYNRYSDLDVFEAMQKVIWRTYSSNGDGGLFPLDGPHQDQRKVEIWYQMSAYLLERYF